MTSCPNCNSELKGDFGLVICGNCQAQVLLDIDGSAQLAAAPSIDVPFVEAEGLIQPTEGDLPAEPNAGLDMFVSAPEFAIEPNGPQSFEPASNDLITPMESQEPAPTNNVTAMEEVVSFANKISAHKDEGHFRYNILVDGIDSADIRQDIVEVLSDSKFAWNKDIILKELKSGQLKILAVPAVKSAILIQRLRHLPLNITWEQYEIHQDAR
jgi:hypothetical protein